MGLIGTFGGYYLYRTIRYALGRNTWRGIGIGTAVAAWTSVVVASIVTAIQLALSGTTFRGGFNSNGILARADRHWRSSDHSVSDKFCFMDSARFDLPRNAFVSRPLTALRVLSN